MCEKLDLYPWEDLFKIVKRSATILAVDIDDEATEIISRRARGTPRIANRFLRRIRDLAQLRTKGKITTSVAMEGLGMLGVDEHGLDAMDRRCSTQSASTAAGPWA